MTELTDAHYLIARLMAQPEANLLLESHRWPNERERWRELVACIFVSAIAEPDHEVREVVDVLERMALLEAAHWGGGTAEEREGLQRRVVTVLTEEGISREDAQRAVTALHEVAAVLTEKYESKVQVLLRKHAHALLGALLREFSPRTISAGAVKEALTLWLQNVANLPISVDDQHVQSFCSAHNLTTVQLTQAADDLDVNVGLLDDLIQLRMGQLKSSALDEKEVPHRE